LIIT